jgi:actin-related protein 6
MLYIFDRVMPNCVTKARSVRTRTFIGDQIDDCKDLSGLYYLLPSQKVRTYSTET